MAGSNLHMTCEGCFARYDRRRCHPAHPPFPFLQDHTTLGLRSATRWAAWVSALDARAAWARMESSARRRPEPPPRRTEQHSVPRARIAIAEVPDSASQPVQAVSVTAPVLNRQHGPMPIAVQDTLPPVPVAAPSILTGGATAAPRAPAPPAAEQPPTGHRRAVPLHEGRIQRRTRARFRWWEYRDLELRRAALLFFAPGVGGVGGGDPTATLPLESIREARLAVPEAAATGGASGRIGSRIASALGLVDRCIFVLHLSPSGGAESEDVVLRGPTPEAARDWMRAINAAVEAHMGSHSVHAATRRDSDSGDEGDLRRPPRWMR